MGGTWYIPNARPDNISTIIDSADVIKEQLTGNKEQLMNNNIVKEKSEKFAIRIVKLYKHLSESKKENVLSKQILRSGTSIGANLAEAECAISKNDFLAKIYIALKESSETQYWLRLLKNTNYITNQEFDSLFADCNEITKILVKTIKTIKNK